MNEPKKQYDILELLEIMKLNKCLKVKLGGMEIELSPMAFMKEISQDEITQMIAKSATPDYDQPNYNISEEDMLKVASPFPFK